MSDRLAGALAEVVGERHVLTDRDVLAALERDWTGRFVGEARLAVRPGSVEELSGVLAVCSGEGAPVVPQGGNTGLVGGSVPLHGEVVLSLGRLASVEEVDRAASQVTAGAGATLAAVQEAARGAGLAFPVDFAARDSATVGGIVATDAGGIHVLRYGTTRAQVAGLEAVLADGTVLSRLAGLVKDTAGYDLPSLLVGSEGTLAVIARARLRLVPRLPERTTALVGLPGVDAAVELFARLRERAPSLEAAELFFRDGLELVCAHARLGDPLPEPHPAYLLVECASRTDPTAELAEALEDAVAPDAIAVAEDGPRREALWALRERHTEAIASLGVVHKLDVSLPIGELAAFVDALPRVVEEAAPGTRMVLFGHVGDGNLHVQLVGPPADDETADEAVLRLVAEHGGSISAEHGIGTAKARWLGLTRTPAEIEAMRSIKGALDPRGILNPHAVLSR